MSEPIYYNHADQVIPVTVQFTKADGTGTVPSAVAVIVTDPNGNSTTYTYTGGNVDPNEVVSDGSGAFHIWLTPFTGLTPPPAGRWSYVWTGVGGVVAEGFQIFTGSFRVIPLATLSGQQRWYCGLEEFKSRNSIPLTDTANDYEISMAIQSASGWISRYCGTHFYQVTEARTYPVTDIYYLPIDQVIPGSVTAFQLDYDGDGVFETSWTEGTNYQVYREGETYNQNYAGINKPFDFVKVVMGNPVAPGGGQFFPFVWPFTHNDRVKITATWGWSEVPPEINQACQIMATQLFREKESPWGIAGAGDLGVVRTTQSPFLIDLIRPYRWPRKTVGI